MESHWMTTMIPKDNATQQCVQLTVGMHRVF
jgi:hypothetical protein